MTAAFTPQGRVRIKGIDMRSGAVSQPIEGLHCETEPLTDCVADTEVQRH